MSFDGFSLPDGAYLPPELIYLMPNISGSKLKVIITILYHDLQVGGGEPLSLIDIEKCTGLSSRQAIRTLKDLMDEGIVSRVMIGQSFAYFAAIKSIDKMSIKTRQMSYQESRESDSKLINLSNKDSLSDSLNLTTGDNDKLSMLKKLRACGVYLKTAQAIVSDNTPEEIEQQLEYYRYALEKNLAQGPGWLVLALKEKWPAPLGYQAEPDEALERKRYNDWDNI